MMGSVTVPAQAVDHVSDLLRIAADPKAAQERHERHVADMKERRDVELREAAVAKRESETRAREETLERQNVADRASIQQARDQLSADQAAVTAGEEKNRARSVELDKRAGLLAASERKHAADLTELARWQEFATRKTA